MNPYTYFVFAKEHSLKVLRFPTIYANMQKSKSNKNSVCFKCKKKTSQTKMFKKVLEIMKNMSIFAVYYLNSNIISE